METFSQQKQYPLLFKAQMVVVDLLSLEIWQSPFDYFLMSLVDFQVFDLLLRHLVIVERQGDMLESFCALT